ncbi:MAG: GDP-mannose 4,6-dehydratase [Candidatus Aenigmatarchaeota archaeon]
MKWEGKSVLVTGAGGFIGSHLVEELLKKNADVTAFLEYTQNSDQKKLSALKGQDFKVETGDLKIAATAESAVKGKDVVFHLASHVSIPYSYIRPAEVVYNNTIMATNMAEAARMHGAFLVHTSTSEVYGTAQYVPIDEKHPLQPQSPYAASKLAADFIVASYCKSFGLKTVTVRPFNTYGPRQSMRAVIPTIIVQALKRKEIKLGDLTPTRDFLFVKDTVSGFMKAAESGVCGEVINLGTNSEISIGDLAEKITGICGGGKVVADQKRKRPKTSEVFRLWCDNRKAKELLGWSPRYSLDEGLRLTAGWIKENISAYDPDAYCV